MSHLPREHRRKIVRRDAENRLASTAGWTYTYDGDGRRVMKCNGSACTLYWTGTGSDPLAESNGGTFTEEYASFSGKRVARRDLPGVTVHYYFPDHLGSASVVTDAGGSVQEESDYYPFGGEIVVNGSDPNHYKFTGKERDAESGLDDFGARYYASSVGRFMSPDWADRASAVPYAIFTAPQSLNLYSYVSDDPLARTDPDGHDCSTKDVGGGVADCAMAKKSDASEPVAGNDEAAAAAGAQNNEWSLSWQVNASASFLGQELKGVYDTTLAPVVDAAAHPVQTVENAASNLVEGVKDVAKDPKGTLTGAAEGAKDLAVQFGSKVASGDPRAIGKAAGLVVDAYIAVRGVQGKEIKVNDNLRIAPAGNRTGGVGELPHYHRRIVGPDGKTVPGGGIGWHRPWEP